MLQEVLVVCIFFNLINTFSVNTFNVYVFNNISKVKSDFLEELGLILMKPRIQRRVENSKCHTSINSENGNTTPKKR